MEAQLNQDSPTPQTLAVNHIFVDSAGHPLRVFVESTEVLNRPKVVRTLRSGGATICDEIREADIIICNSEEESGKQLIQDWEEKTILETGWVQESVQRGKACLADDNWGGFVAHVGSGATQKNHLPTPRETPSEPKTTQDEPTMLNQYPHNQTDYYAQASSSAPPASQILQQQMPQQMLSGQSINVTPAALLQNFSGGQMTLPVPLVAQMMAMLNQQGINPAAMGMAPMSSQVPMNILPGQAFPQGFPQQQQPMTFMSQAGLYAQGPFPHAQQATFPQQMMSMHFPQAADTQSPAHSGQFHNSMSPDMQAKRNGGVSESHRDSPMDEDDLSSSLKRKARSMDAPPSRSSTKKGKARAEDDRPAKHPRLSEDYDEPPLPYTQSSTPPVKQPRRESLDQSGKLFIGEDDEPYQFFVQVEIRNRSKIADAIKKNGGRMVSEIADADFVILGHPTTRNFEEWLRQSGYFGKVPVKPQWVFHSVEQDEILDTDDYVYEGFKVEKKRGRPGASGQRYVVTQAKPVSKSSTKASAKEMNWPDYEMAEDEDEEEDEASEPELSVKRKEKAATKEKREKKEKKEKVEKKKTGRKVADADEGAKSGGKVKGKAKGKAMAKESSPPLKGHWEPSPPPPTRVVEHVVGRNLYTKEDIDYCDEYIPILLARDPTMSAYRIAEKLFAKMPHHTLKSWNTHITAAPRREKLERMRRRAEIQCRKAGGERLSSQDIRQPTPQQLARTSSEPTQSGSQDPFTIMTEFFVSGRADSLADSDVWNVMAREYPQLTAQDWENYWVQNNEAISQEVSRLTGLNASQEGVESSKMTAKAEPE